MLWVVDEKFI
jgi:hypothetical protein